MPGGDRTGPTGIGSMTGRGAGYCAGRNMPGYTSAGFGRPFGIETGRGQAFRTRGYGGGGRGRRNRFFATGQSGWMRFGDSAAATYPKPAPEGEEQKLQSQIARLRSELEAIDKRLAEIGAGAEKQA